MADTAQPIEAIIFDFAGVLVDWSFYRPFAGYFTNEEVDGFVARTDFFSLNALSDAGRPWVEGRAELAERFPDDVHFLDVYLANFAKSVSGPIAGMPELFDEVEATGLPIYGLTNWSAENIDIVPPKVPMVRRLKHIVVSGEVEVAKPNPLIFERTTRILGLDPAVTLFIDDNEDNVASAQRAGYQSVHFVDAQTLRDYLLSRHVLPGKTGILV